MEDVEPAPVNRAAPEAAGSSASPRALGALWLALATAAYVPALLRLHRGFALDREINDKFFTRPCAAPDAHACWAIDKNAKVPTFWLHTVPEKLVIAVCVVSALVLAAGYLKPRFRAYREKSFLLLLALAGVPSAVGLMKYGLPHYCPSQTDYYGGPATMMPFPHMNPDCFPAGHPASAFGLIILFFSTLPAGWRYGGLLGGLAAGGTLSVIQFARGEHYFSHALATLLTAVFMGVLLKLYTRYFAPRGMAASCAS